MIRSTPRHLCALLLAAILAGLLCACGKTPQNDQGPESPPTQEETLSSPAPETADPLALDVSVIPGRGEGELLFSFTLEEWITAFGAHYDYLRPVEEWRCWSVEQGIHSPFESIYYEFIANETMYALPAMAAYVPAEEDHRVQELTVDFDDHAYQDEAYALYEDLCFAAIETLLPSLSEEEITAIYTDLNALSYDELRLNDRKYRSGVVPLRLYHKDGVGLYGHFALGDYVRLCIIPVTEESLQAFAQQGTELRPLS